MVLNRQSRVRVNLPAIRAYVRRLRRNLELDGRDLNVCLVSDREIARLNARHRGKARPTDVLSFPWEEPGAASLPARPARAAAELNGFLGDVVISAETARRNARAAGHSTAKEIRWLILHGALHLLGYDHSTDQGEMTALELSLREKLGV